jgi:acetyl esterase/lipase
MKHRIAGLAFAAALAAGVAQAQTGNSYDAARTSLVTNAEKAPSPQPYDRKTPRGVQVVSYASGPGEMLAWVMRPVGDASSPKPVVVFAHGGFALGGGDDEMAQPFVDAGFIVMLPAVRGENGNPGNFELFLGEVDDLIAAGRKARTLTGADPDRIYLFGHSIGGGLATLAALSADHPFRIVGAAGGNYPRFDCGSIAREWGTFQPTKDECEARFPDQWLPSLQTPLFSYVGTGDAYAVGAGRAFKRIATDKYHLVTLKGDHFTSVDAAIAAFIAETRK